MKTPANAFAILNLWISATCAAAGIEQASMPVDLSYGYGNASNSTMQGVLELNPELALDMGEDRRFVTSLRLRIDSEDRLEPGRPALDSYANLSRPLVLGDSGTAEIRDFYFEWQAGGTVRLGKQQIVWGRLDGIKVLDVVNPQDFREFILDDFGDSRIGLFSAYLDYTLGAWRAELALVPDATGHAIPESGAWFELTAPRFRFGAPVDAPALPVTGSSPAHELADGAAGLRLSRRIGRVDVSALAFSGQDHEPLGRVIERDGETLIERYYERREVYGVGAERSLGGLVLRGEYAYQPDRVFNTRDAGGLGVAALDQHRAAIGVDLDGPAGIFINVQYLVDTVRDAPVDLVRPERDEVATVFLRRSFGYDRLSVEARWYRSLRDGDELVSFAIGYALGGNAEIRLAADQFGGAVDGLFGQFARRDRVTLSIGYTF